MKRKLKTPIEFTGQVMNITHEGRGITHFNQKKTFVVGALPQEMIRAAIIKKRASYNEATLIEVLEPSPHRVKPPCDHFNLCGGCSLQHMSMVHQLEFKQQSLLEQLKHFGHVTPESILPPIIGSEINYRRKARLGVKFVTKKNKLLVGFREKSGRYLADLQDCLILHEHVGKNLMNLAQCIASLSQYQSIPQVEIAVGEDATALIFRHLETLPYEDKEKLIAFCKEYNYHLYLHPNPPAKVYKCWPADQSERILFTIPKFDIEFKVHPMDFMQVNLDLNRLMVNQALSLLDIKQGETMLDLFCGVGNFSLPSALFAQSVTGIEGNPEMVQRAKDNALHNNIQNAQFHAANLMEPHKYMSWVKKYDKVLLDPPRAGAKEILPFFKDFAPKKIVYISCNPSTLSRDTHTLVHEQGYCLQQVGIVNMFPHTAHIEAMAVFEQ